MPHVRIMTCNLYNGGADPAALRDVIAQYAPDVVAAQELAPNAAAVLAEALPHGFLDPSLNYRGNGIALRHPAPVEPFEMPHRDGLVTMLDPSVWPGLGRSLQLINVHLTNPIDRPLGATRRSRRAQVAAIVNHVARTTSPLAIVGDLNASPIWPAYRRLIRVLRDGVRDTGSTQRTWGPTWWSPRLLRIDHALVRGGVRVVNAETVRIRRSDHSGLIIDVAVE